MKTKENEQLGVNLDAQIAYWQLPYALTKCVEVLLTTHPIKRAFVGYHIDLGNSYIFLGPCDLEEYLQWLEMAYPNKAKKIRERVREADEHYFGRNYEAM